MVGLVLVLIYLVAAIWLAKRYFWRRHGVAPLKGDAGTTTAGFIGLSWPVSIWFPQVRQPSPCGHHRHVLERDRIRQEIRAVEELQQRRDR